MFCDPTHNTDRWALVYPLKYFANLNNRKINHK